MKYIYVTLIVLFFSGCRDEFDINSVTNENIEFIHSNYQELKEIFDRSKIKNLSIFIVTSGVTTCEQRLDNRNTNYCVGENWNSKNIIIEKQFQQQLNQDSISLTSIQKMMDMFKFYRIEITNNNIEFHSEDLKSSFILFDLREYLKSELNLKNKSNSNKLERPCTIDIGDGFSIYFERLEHGISKNIKMETTTCS